MSQITLNNMNFLAFGANFISCWIRIRNTNFPSQLMCGHFYILNAKELRVSRV
jgi:hypothetical protein